MNLAKVDDYTEITNEEYREELRKLLDGVEDYELLHDFHTYATQRISGRAADYHVSNPDYRDMIIEMVGEIKNEGTLEYLYTFLQLFIEKWG